MGQDYRYTGSFAADPTDPGGPGSLTLTDQSSSHLPQMYVKGSSFVGNAETRRAGIYGITALTTSAGNCIPATTSTARFIETSSLASPMDSGKPSTEMTADDSM